ncbi:hypothetical protein [Aureimonas phyllosphaerae]|uniref:Phage tail tube protein, GTA-gp10 n=1 Tax=Aureimonas phyllosphaerae TaxID=1166078 RepID=A0A7W6BVI0_9HYPH|nr:hypothetical protein [Aureimonas phyllosphaerae]MBB3937672.1 hypothetical protein [Aureimonas phyllosphaerae]MBB3961793.1 hypothetical protein [Aureimonas phyllosphaerae]SFF44943.1 hypothetical protein SAMN05216566_11411 [Aureimonas phyllosphaerae]
MSKQTLSAGVAITLGDEEYELKASLKAATAVSNRFGGFANALAAVAGSDLAAIQFVVRQGVPLRDISSKDLDEVVWLAGTRHLMGDVMSYVTRLANGGRDPDLEGEEAEKAEEGAEGNG